MPMMIAAAGLVLLGVLQGGATDEPAGGDRALPPHREDEPGLGRVRSLYLAAVEDQSAIDRGLREIERLRSRPDLAEEATLTAYQGALITLRAKHALWPTAKLRHLRHGLEILDATVAGHPAVAEVRYLRLMSCYFLPPVLGRASSVREDFAALARLLPRSRSEYPSEVYRAVVGFVLENGRLSGEQRGALEGVLRSDDG